MSYWEEQGYDERQILERYRTGFQALMIMLVLIFVDATLKENGLVWAAPLDTAIILFTISLGYFSVKIIWRDAYFAQRQTNSKVLFGIFGVCAAVLVILTPFDIASGSFHLIENGMLSSDGVSCFTAVYLISVLAAWQLRQRKNRREETE